MTGTRAGRNRRRAAGPTGVVAARIRRREVLGVLIHGYERDA